jgi:hypothetical protein
MITKFSRAAIIAGRQAQPQRMFATKVADYNLMDQTEIANNIKENTYNASVRPKFNYAGMCEMVFDAHNVGLKPHGFRFISSAFGLSLFGNYYYYYMLAPFNSLYFGLTCASSFIFGLMLTNASMSEQMSVIEMLVLPTRDIVRFVLMNGGIIETTIASVNFSKIENTRVTLNAVVGERKYRLILDLNQKFLKTDYINTELLMAIAHPDVHKI